LVARKLIIYVGGFGETFDSFSSTTELLWMRASKIVIHVLNNIFWEGHPIVIVEGFSISFQVMHLQVICPLQQFDLFVKQTNIIVNNIVKFPCVKYTFDHI
jgi:hypothetical protein